MKRRYHVTAHAPIHSLIHCMEDVRPLECAAEKREKQVTRWRGLAILLGPVIAKERIARMRAGQAVQDFARVNRDAGRMLIY